MEKYIKDGKVAVVRYYSYGNWSTQTGLSQEDRELLMFHPKIVQKVLDGKSKEITKNWVLDNSGKDFDFLPYNRIYLEIIWIPVGETFALIDDNEGETVVYKEDFFKA